MVQLLGIWHCYLREWAYLINSVRNVVLGQLCRRETDLLRLLKRDSFPLNVPLCDTLQINRTKNKWKFTLKDGIMNLNGKDYVFQKLTGDAEWWWPSHLVTLLYIEHLPGSNIQLVLQWVWLVLPPGECYSNGCSGTEFGCVRSTWVIFTGDVAGTIHWHPVQLGDVRCHCKRQTSCPSPVVDQLATGTSSVVGIIMQVVVRYEHGTSGL